MDMGSQNPLKVLVVGGAGYIGSHVVYDLIRAGHDVAVADNLSTGMRAAVHPNARFYQADITRLEEITNVFSQEAKQGKKDGFEAPSSPIDVVMHFAAKLDVAESVDQPLQYYHNNVEGVRVLLDAMLLAQVKNIVFSSTAAVYGDPSVQEPIKEDTELTPINPYGASKLAAEQLIQWTASANDINYAILRYFNASGADDSLKIGLEKPKYTHLIPLAVRAALGLEDSLKIFGDDWPTHDGSCVRDYIHVSDLSYAHLLAADYLVQKQDSLLVNLGTEHGSSVKEIIAAVERLRLCPYQVVGRRQGDPAILIADAQKARHLLGWKAERTVNDIVESDMRYRLAADERSVLAWE
ncbi:MAG: UDP-glucose 4-epimerase GalE [Coriobacteriia bacterium]|nr:UDP-glucose 4-epimerase GalE [Coriobacteriia bacterium]MCL2870287.1 UDP-glucose 4-epimerase GalE [Coriobacteriia bacterium]